MNALKTLSLDGLWQTITRLPAEEVAAMPRPMLIATSLGLASLLGAGVAVALGWPMVYTALCVLGFACLVADFVILKTDKQVNPIDQTLRAGTLNGQALSTHALRTLKRAKDCVASLKRELTSSLACQLSGRSQLDQLKKMCERGELALQVVAGASEECDEACEHPHRESLLKKYLYIRIRECATALQGQVQTILNMNDEPAAEALEVNYIITKLVRTCEERLGYYVYNENRMMTRHRLDDEYARLARDYD